MRRVLPLLLLGLTAGAGPVAGQGDPLGRSPSRFAVLDGVKLHYKSLGLGRTAVVLVHGWACDLSVWRAQAPVLDGRVRVVAVDLPGHGRSDKPVRAYSMDFFARSVNAVLEAAGVDRAVLVGHSMGTPVARQFFRLFPGKTLAMVVVDGSLRSPGLDSAAIERQVAQFSGPNLRDLWPPMIAPMLPGPELEAARRQVILAAQATPAHVVTASIRGMLDPTIWGNDLVGVPVLAVMAKGPNWPAAYRTYVHDLVPDLRYEELDQVHHFLMLERPDLFNALLIEFLRAQGVLKG
ncbi:MAG: alpha/beta hydrolase [Gemmatimonadetes bacterium]|nr:alpha/beta hydrolase [Gemmatimonadota bacterium]MCC7132216.1 alpha/beta hydrolase [Gemmatimonadales bacterium]